MVKINRYIISFIIILSSCSSQDKELYKFIQHHCIDGDTCVINFKDIYDVDFDKFYIIGEVNNRETISKIINLPYKNTKYVFDSRCRLIFIKENRVVEEFETNSKYLYFEPNDCDTPLVSSRFLVNKQGKSKSYYLRNIH